MSNLGDNESIQDVPRLIIDGRIQMSALSEEYALAELSASSSLSSSSLEGIGSSLRSNISILFSNDSQSSDQLRDIRQYKHTYGDEFGQNIEEKEKQAQKIMNDNNIFDINKLSFQKNRDYKK